MLMLHLKIKRDTTLLCTCMFQHIIFCAGQNDMKKPHIFQDDWKKFLFAISYCGDAVTKH